MSRKLRNCLAVLLVLAGLAIFFYPTVSEFYVQWKAQEALESIRQLRDSQNPQPSFPAEQAATEPPLTTTPQETTEPVTEPATEPVTEPPSEMELLYQELVAYNQRIYQEGQSNFKDPFSYQAAPIDLTEYGFEENIIATIWIPRLELELPVYLGATKDNLAKGVALLGETSLPVAGENTNVAIAGHRGWRGTPMFRDIQLIQIDDKITLTTPWETLIYRVCELEVILPSDTDEVLIQPGRQLLTLMTCHPYTKNYQRYLVRAERSTEDEAQSREDDVAEAEQTFDSTARTVLSKDPQGNVQQIQIEPVSIQPVADEGLQDGSAYSNRVILLEKYAPPVVLALLVLLLVVKLLKKRRNESS